MKSKANSIILEGSYEKSFMHLALQEGFATLKNEGLEHDDSYYSFAKKRSEVLELCVLYDKVYLYAYNDLYILPSLTDINFVDYVDPGIFAKDTLDVADARMVPYKDIRLYKYIKPILVPYLRKKIKNFTNEYYDTTIAILTSEEYREWAITKLPKFKIFVDAGAINTENDLDYYIKKLDRSQHDYIYSSLIYDQIFDLLNLLQHSSNLSVAVASELVSPSVRNLNKKLYEKELLKYNQNYYGLYKIALEEIEFMPVISSLEQALKIKQNPIMKDFREHLQYYLNALQEGDYRIAIKLRKDIKSANNALKVIKPFKAISRWVTYMSLPYIPVSMIFSHHTLINLGIGTAFTGSSVGIQAAVDAIEEKYRWTMIGKY